MSKQCKYCGAQLPEGPPFARTVPRARSSEKRQSRLRFLVRFIEKKRAYYAFG